MTSMRHAPVTDRPVALVAGASRGLGLLIARELGRRGHRVVICSRSADELGSAIDWLRSSGVEATSAVCDVGDAEAVDRLVEHTERDLGPIEVMICVAGVIQVGPLDNLRRREFVDALQVMLWGPINTALAVAGPMRARGRGRIGIVTSVGGRIAAPHLLPYSTAKFGAFGFARGLRTELAGSGVRVAPGLASAVLEVTVRLLPRPSTDSGAEGPVEGRLVAGQLKPRARAVVHAATVLGRRAALRLNEIRDRGPRGG